MFLINNSANSMFAYIKRVFINKFLSRGLVKLGFWSSLIKAATVSKTSQRQYFFDL